MKLRDAIREIVRHIILHGYRDAAGEEMPGMRANRDVFRRSVQEVARNIVIDINHGIGGTLDAYTLRAAQAVHLADVYDKDAWPRASRAVWATLGR